ncbi:MATE family efflux transporter [Shewanella cyperi]|nr:MATE family efflux transporter [Shewanella cyperi]
MKNLTQGSIVGHLTRMSVPIGIGMLIQTLYFLVDLYFVGRLGEAALAGVAAAGNLLFLVMGLTQVLNVGTATLIAQAVGRKQQQHANLLFNQSTLISLLLGLAVLLGGYGFGSRYMQTLSTDAATVSAGRDYLLWMLPNMGLQFVAVVMGAALRGTGVVKPTMLVQMLSVLVNIVLAPVLIAGWGTGHPMGVAGAGLASSLAALTSVVLLAVYFHRLEHYVGFDPGQWRPQWPVWRKIFGVGLPAGAEFMLMFIYMAVIFFVIKGFGADAQAGFGLGYRVMQAVFLPAMAVAFSIPAIAGQNFGAGLGDRVRSTFYYGVAITAVLMALLGILCYNEAPLLATVFSQDPGVLAIAAGFLTIVCWNFVPSAIVFVCSGLFQGLGNTWPALLSTASRLLTFAIPALWLSRQADFYIEQIWLLSVVTVILQCCFSLWLLQREMNKRLDFVEIQQS